MNWTKLKGILRVQLYLLAIGGAVTGTTLARAYYAGGRLAESLSESLVSQMGVTSDAAQTLQLNGQSFAFSIAIVPEEPSAVLDKAEAYCANHSGDLQAAFGDMMKQPELLEAGLTEDDASRLTTLRRDLSTKRGMGGDVTCFTRPDDDSDGGGILRRIEAFSKGLMAGELGRGHYMKAIPTSDGKQTRLLSVYTEGALDFVGMFPTEGDAPGTDPTKVARPPRSTRLFSAVMGNTGHGSYVYVSEEDASSVIRFFDEHMQEEGWQRIDYMENPEQQHGRAYVKDNEAMILGAEDAGDGTSDVSILLSGSRQSVRAQASAP